MSAKRDRLRVCFKTTTVIYFFFYKSWSTYYTHFLEVAVVYKTYTCDSSSYGYSFLNLTYVFRQLK